MKRAGIVAAIAMFLLALMVPEGAVAGLWNVTIENKTDKPCFVYLFHRGFPSPDCNPSGEAVVDAGKSVTLSPPGGLCPAEVQYSCRESFFVLPTPEIGGSCGCLGYGPSKDQTCCWNTQWQIYKDGNR